MLRVSGAEVRTPGHYLERIVIYRGWILVWRRVLMKALNVRSEVGSMNSDYF